MSFQNSLISSDSKFEKALKLSIEKGLNFLEENCCPLVGFQNKFIGKNRDELVEEKVAEEIFTSTFAVDLLSKLLRKETIENLVKFITPENSYGAVNFHKYERLVPDEVDSTSVVHQVLYREGILKNGKRMRDVARLVILNTDNDGIIQTYFPPRSHRMNRRCPGVVANCLRFLYATNYHGDALESENYLFKLLERGEHENVVNYYPSPDTILFFIAHAVVWNPRALLRFGDLIGECVKKRFGKTEYPIDIASRILCSAHINILNRTDMRERVMREVGILLAMQNENGSWPKDILFKMGRHDVFYGGFVISTIFVLAALDVVLKQFKPSCNG